ncbi:hypothetical protein D3C77_479150 [compost metagenome]
MLSASSPLALADFSKPSVSKSRLSLPSMPRERISSALLPVAFARVSTIVGIAARIDFQLSPSTLPVCKALEYASIADEALSALAEFVTSKKLKLSITSSAWLVLLPMDLRLSAVPM